MLSKTCFFIKIKTLINLTKGIYNDLKIRQKHILFNHFMKNKELLKQVNLLKMKGFTKDINKYKNNLK